MGEKSAPKVPTFKLWESRGKVAPTVTTTTNSTDFDAARVESSLEDFDMDGVDPDDSISPLATSPTVARGHLNDLSSRPAGVRRTFRQSSGMGWMSPEEFHELDSKNNPAMERSFPYANENVKEDMVEVPYDYKPFFGDKLVNQSKIDALQEAEMTEHCLIFHRNVEHDLGFRPDLTLNCRGMPSKPLGQGPNKSDAEDTPFPMKASPGKRVLRGSHANNSSTNTPTQNPMKSTPLGTATNTTTLPYQSKAEERNRRQLEEFWRGSDLLASLDSDTLQLLSNAMNQHTGQQARTYLHTEDQPPPLESHETTMDPGQLQRKCHEAWNQVSWTRSHN